MIRSAAVTTVLALAVGYAVLWFGASPLSAVSAPAAPGARLVKVQQAGVADYRGWLTVQLKNYVPTRARLTREMAPFFAKKSLKAWVTRLHDAFVFLRAHHELHSPTVGYTMHPFRWLHSTIHGPWATLRFLGYEVHQTHNDPHLVMPDRRFVLHLHHESGTWKITRQTAHWRSPTGPIGEPHDETAYPPLL